MKRLLGSELRTMLDRPLVRAFAAGALVAIVVAGVVVLLASRKGTLAHIRALDSQQQQAIERCVRTGYNPPLSGIAADDRREFCASEGVPAPPFTFHLTQLLDIVEGADVKGTAMPLVILSFLLGASFAGADWQSGAMPTLLGWEPRRLRVLAAKVVVPAAVMLCGVLAAQVILGAALAPAAVLKGTTEGADPTWLVTLAGAAARVGLLSVLAAVVGSSLAMIGRSTAAALSFALLYGLVELFIRGFENPAWQRWLIGENAGVFVTLRQPTQSHPGFSPAVALILLIVYTGAILSFSGVTLLRRDVT